MYQKKTLKKMYPTERRLAESYNVLELELRRLKRWIKQVHEAEMSARALANMNNPELVMGINGWTGELTGIGKATNSNQFPPAPVPYGVSADWDDLVAKEKLNG